MALLAGQGPAGCTELAPSAAQASANSLRDDAERLLEQAQHIRRQLLRARSKVEDAKTRAEERCLKILHLAQETDGLIHADMALRILPPSAEGRDREGQTEKATGDLPFAEPELIALADQAAEAERREQEAQQELESLREALARTGIRASEVRIADKGSVAGLSNEPVAEVLHAIAGGLPLQEQVCYEWARMLQHDKPVHCGLMMIEAECNYWEDHLHGLLAPETCKPSMQPQGLERLEAELSELTAEERMTKIGCGTCLQLLSQKVQHPALRELEASYALVDHLRKANDALANERTVERWQRLASSAKDKPDLSALSPSSTRRAMEAHLPPGPKFHSVAQLLRPGAQELPLAFEPDDAPRMPAAVLSPAEWAATSSCQAVNGLSFLYGPTSQARLQPSQARSTSLEQGRQAQYCFEPSIFSASGEGWDQSRSVSTMHHSTELLRQVFEEPLSEAVGTRRPATSSSARQGPKMPSSLAEHPPRSGWVTFDSRGKAPTQSFPEVKAPHPNGFSSRDSQEWGDGPSQWDFAWPDSVLQPPSEPLSQRWHSEIPAFSD